MCALWLCAMLLTSANRLTFQWMYYSFFQLECMCLLLLFLYSSWSRLKGTLLIHHHWLLCSWFFEIGRFNHVLDMIFLFFSSQRLLKVAFAVYLNLLLLLAKRFSWCEINLASGKVQVEKCWKPLARESKHPAPSIFFLCHRV